jgi:hypothetical protein
LLAVVTAESDEVMLAPSIQIVCADIAQPFSKWCHY